MQTVLPVICRHALNKVLSEGTKTQRNSGRIVGAGIEDIMTPAQYERGICNENSGERIRHQRLPGQEYVYLPIG